MKQFLGVLILIISVSALADPEIVDKSASCRSCVENPDKKMCNSLLNKKRYCCDINDTESMECKWMCQEFREDAFKYDKCPSGDSCGKTTFNLTTGKKGHVKIKSLISTKEVCKYQIFIDPEVRFAEIKLSENIQNTVYVFKNDSTFWGAPM